MDGTDANGVAAVLARLPFRAGDAGDGAEPDARGWIGGLTEARQLLGRLANREPEPGRAFGARWPFVEMAGALVAPGLPVAVTEEPAEGADGTYRVDGLRVLREAAGAEQAVLEREAAGTAGSPPDLLWFTTGARWLVRGGLLHVEDAFAEVVAPATRARLEALLVRRLRCDPGLLEGLQRTETAGPTRLRVRRPLALAGDRWREPGRLLGARAGVSSVRRSEDGLELALERRAVALVNIDETPDGWRASVEGDLLGWTAARLAAEGGSVVYEITLAPRLDAVDDGVRARLAFDLLSDLLTLERRPRDL